MVWFELNKKEEKSVYSYSHDSEDIIVEKLIGKVESFIDIGANDGIKYSNVYRFAKQGAKGICFEPIPSIFRRLEQNYKDYHVYLHQQAVSNSYDNICMIDAGMLSHLPSTVDKGLTCNVINTPEMPTRNVWVDTIPAADVGVLWRKEFGPLCPPDVVSIDVEGHEHVILQCWAGDFNPKAFIIETHCRLGEDNYTWKHQHYDEIEKRLSVKGYKIAYVTTMNTIFIKEEI